MTRPPNNGKITISTSPLQLSHSALFTKLLENMFSLYITAAAGKEVEKTGKISAASVSEG